MEESRKQFEEWFANRFVSLPAWGEKTALERSAIKYAAWIGWQASRAAIEIEAPAFIDSREALSKGFTVDYSNGFGDGMDAYEANIRAAGLTVKGDR